MEMMRFECQPGCTACCTQKGYVWLTEDDIGRAAAFLGITAKAFEKQYIYRTKNKRRLKVPAESRCSFLLENGCSIHPAKPTQCRTFPFWPEVCDDEKDWHKTASYCPGIGKGELIQIEAARARADEMRQAYPELYD